ncbi:MAG TPA: trimethylamine methyltransferase family protein, partial [Acidobacteriota bacterium]|nr:trimethylamine methyltransferase family protein [Acidobacteriota bacterium]
MRQNDQKESSLNGRPFPQHSTQDCRKISEASLEILERVGVRLHLEEAVQLLERAGASVTDGNLVRIPSSLVERALDTVPKTLTLHTRDGVPVIPLEGTRSFFGPGSDCLNILDHRTGDRRKPVLEDVTDGVTLCDALPNIDFVMSLLLPTDVDGTIADRYQLQIMLNNTAKPLIFVAYEFQGCLDAVEMFKAVVGGADALKSKPMAACYINVPSGLVHNEDSLRKLLYLSEAGFPSLYIPSSAGGVKSPVTPAGTVAFDNAGVLVGLVLSQLQQEGSPVIIPGMTGGTFDMRTLVSSYCEPERTLAHSLARFYGLPMFGLGGASESKTADGQAAAEAALTLLVDVLAGSHLIHDLGYLESGLTFSFTQLLLCDEIVSWIKALTRQTEVSSRTLAVDVVESIGSEGQFLNTEHTLDYYRERWYPSLFDRSSFDPWAQNGSKSLAERAAERIDRLLIEHKPAP